MSSPSYKVTKKTLLLPLVGILAFLIYLYLFRVDVPTILTYAQQMNLMTYSLAVLLILAEAFVFSISWHFLLHFLSIKISLVKQYLYIWYGVYIDIIIPAESVSSEIVKIYLVAREQNAEEQNGITGKVVATLVVQRLMGMGVNIAGLVAGIIILWTEKQVSGIIFNLASLLTFLTAILLILLSMLCVKENWTFKVIDVLIRFAAFISRGRWKLQKLKEEALKAAKIFHGSMKQFAHAPKTVSASLIFYTFSWFLNQCLVYLVFLSFGYTMPWGIIILTSSIVVAIKSVPIGIPFEVGLPEITMTVLYNLLGVPLEIAAISTIFIRILTVWLKFFIGFAAQQLLEFKAIKTRNRGTSVLSHIGLENRGSAFWRCLNEHRHRKRGNPAFG